MPVNITAHVTKIAKNSTSLPRTCSLSKSTVFFFSNCFSLLRNTLSADHHQTGRMRTKGKSQNGVRHSQPRNFHRTSGGKTLKKCKNNGKSDDIVLIDSDDDENINNVVNPNFSKSQKQNGNCSINIICIDEEDEVSDKNQGAGFASDGPSNSKFSPSPNKTQSFTDEDGDECQFLHEIVSPVKLSKCKRTYCAKAPNGNCYGLGLDLDSDQSDKNQIDIDYVEDSLGEIQARWEKANKRKKGGILNGEYVNGAQLTTSGGAREKVVVEKENKTGKNSENASCNENIKFRFADAENSMSVPAFHEKTHVANSDPNCSNSSYKENFFSKKPLFQNSKLAGESRVSNDFRKNGGKDPPIVERKNDHFINSEFEGLRRESAGKDPPWKIPDLGEREDHPQEKINPVPKNPSLGETLAHNEAETEEEHTDTFPDCLINNREKLKETDEYKQAEEEEWASRQQALRLQAEEAQKQRQMLKRKKAESLRLLDMERRQKQRVEEIRETQKKDEENMNMKEKLRAEVRMELKEIELMSLDMGSLLRGLGVDVSGGLQPQPHEIRAAYKKALLSFHPDRAPASDIRKLVEAEEKFKLISRMKEKFLLTS